MLEPSFCKNPARGALLASSVAVGGWGSDCGCDCFRLDADWRLGACREGEAEGERDA